VARAEAADSLTSAQLLKLLELMQQQTRLRLDPPRQQKARNFLSASSANARAVCSIFGAFLYHCGLPLPRGGQDAGEVSVQVLECFEQGITLILGVLFDPRKRDQASSIITNMKRRADFLRLRLSPAMHSARGSVQGTDTSDIAQAPLYLTSRAPHARAAGTLQRSQSEILQQSNVTTSAPVRRLGRYLSEADVDAATAGSEDAPGQEAVAPGRGAGARNAKSLWRRLRQRTGLISFLLLMRKRKLVASQV
jgi:hypothetical protein